MTDQSNEPVIRAAFERCLIEGLKGQPIVGKDGPVIDKESGEVLKGNPDSSFLNVVRAYLKDLLGDPDAKRVPKNGTPREGGLLDQYMQGRGKGLPFGKPQ